MTLIELTTFLFAFATSAVGAYFGWTYGDTLWTFIGMAAGFVAGVPLGVVFIVSVGYPAIVLERSRQRRAWEPFFGKYWSRHRATSWAALTASLTQDDCVRGEVVHRTSLGVCLDTGHGFPALLRVECHEGADGEALPQVGDAVVARVRFLDGGCRIIELRSEPDSKSEPEPPTAPSAR